MPALVPALVPARAHDHRHGIDAMVECLVVVVVVFSGQRKRTGLSAQAMSHKCVFIK